MHQAMIVKHDKLPTLFIEGVFADPESSAQGTCAVIVFLVLGIWASF